LIETRAFSLKSKSPYLEYLDSQKNNRLRVVLCGKNLTCILYNVVANSVRVITLNANAIGKSDIVYPCHLTQLLEETEDTFGEIETSLWLAKPPSPTNPVKSSPPSSPSLSLSSSHNSATASQSLPFSSSAAPQIIPSSLPAGIRSGGGGAGPVFGTSDKEPTFPAPLGSLRPLWEERSPLSPSPPNPNPSPYPTVGPGNVIGRRNFPPSHPGRIPPPLGVDPRVIDPHLPPGVPPGARYDPIGPGLPRRHPGPNPDHFAPPGWGQSEHDKDNGGSGSGDYY
jgi:hypothetical protein